MKITRKNTSGFTVIELVIIILVIVVLAAVFFRSYASVQARSRNATRQRNLYALQHKIELFYSNNGYFPNLNDLNNATWRTKNMSSLGNGVLVDPSSSCDPSVSACLGGSDKAVSKQYQYYPTQSDGKPCAGAIGSKADQTCAQYKLFASYEGSFNGIRYDELQNID
jgi:Tfp pilus assembly protein PilE